MFTIVFAISSAGVTEPRIPEGLGSFPTRSFLDDWGVCAAARSESCVCGVKKSVGKPDAGNQDVRFDERGGKRDDALLFSTRAVPRLYPFTARA